MTFVTTHERPGVYSVYEAAAAVTASSRSGTAAIAAQSAGGTAGTLYTLTSYSQAAAAFGKEDPMTQLVKVLLANGAAKVLAVPVASEEDYAAAFLLLNSQEDVKTVVCDSTTLTVQQALRDSVEEVSQLRRERIAVVGAPEEETAEALVARAKALASPRVVLVAPAAAGEDVPGALTAAAVAGAICGEGDPALPLGGAVLQGLSGLTASYSEAELDALIQGGVTPVEAAGGRISVVRGVTTRTETGGAADNTWRDLSTILVVDYVVPGVRQALQTRFTRTKNTPQVQGAIRSQVILELERYKAAEIITGYGEVTAQALEEDPSVCLVTFSFTVAHGLNQIWLSAQITV